MKKNYRLNEFTKSNDLFLTIIKSLLSTNNNLDKDVINHCNKGLEILSIINADVIYNTGVEKIFEKKFDSFFNCFGIETTKHKESIDIYMIVKHIDICISYNQIFNLRKII